MTRHFPRNGLALAEHAQKAPLAGLLERA